MIDSDIPWGLINGPALIILFGYFDNENGLWNSKLRSIILVVARASSSAKGKKHICIILIVIRVPGKVHN